MSVKITSSGLNWTELGRSRSPDVPGPINSRLGELAVLCHAYRAFLAYTERVGWCALASGSPKIIKYDCTCSSCDEWRKRAYFTDQRRATRMRYHDNRMAMRTGIFEKIFDFKG